MTDLLNRQITQLAHSLAHTTADECACDEVDGLLAAAAELAASGGALADLMPQVQRHIEQCPCCHAELTALLRILAA